MGKATSLPQGGAMREAKEKEFTGRISIAVFGTQHPTGRPGPTGKIFIVSVVPCPNQARLAKL